MDELAAIPPRRRTGTEHLIGTDGRPVAQLCDFWAWSTSDTLSNAIRGVLAEFIVATALGVADGVREEWAAWDVTSRAGTRVEVKSAAYIQSWSQKRLSRISFGVRATRNWDAQTGMASGPGTRLADVYVFALLATTDQSVIDPLALNQWEFYVLPTAVLNQRTRSQHSITLPSLQALTEPVEYPSLATAIEAARTRP